MCMNNLKKYFVLFFLFLFIVGCPKKWYFSIIDTSNPTQPHFCFSTSEKCKGSGVKFAFIDIREVNEKEEFIKKMWWLEPTSNDGVNHVIYGNIPKGYNEVIPAVPLEIGKYYSVCGIYFFRLVEVGDSIKYEIFLYSLTNRIV
ncbi:MAG: hypothetical protein ABIK92_08530 [Pseudomonadota bacterium]